MIRFLWTKVIDPYLTEIADNRRQGDVAEAVFGTVMGVTACLVVLMGICLVATGIFTLVTNAPVVLLVVLLGMACFTGLVWLVWTLAGDGSNDRDRSR